MFSPSFFPSQNKIAKSKVATRIYVKYPLSSSYLSGVGSYWPKFVLWHLCRPVSAVIFCAICVPPVGAVIFCAICVPPASAIFFCAIFVAQSAFLSFAQIVFPSWRCYLLRNLYRPVSSVLFCEICVPSVRVVLFCAICFAQ